MIITSNTFLMIRFCSVLFTEAATFRFDKDVLDHLKLEAGQKRLNPSTS